MPNSGPSKDELRDYWTNNRQYFDELAKYYLEADREYYDKFIAPFYSNPFGSAPRSQSGTGSGARILIILMAAIGVLAAGAVAFFVMTPNGQDSGEDKQVISPRVIVDTVKKTENPIIIAADTTAKIVKTKSPYYDKAQKYYHAKDYDAAEQYFKLIDKNDVNYMNAQKRLFEIKMIRDGDKSDEDQPVEPKNRNRKQPLERIH
jgi:flagellar basal body-associated protein FliL